MAIGRSEIWSWVHDVVPVFAMLMLTCLDMSLLTVVKAAMNGGLGSIAYVVYHNSLGTIILFPIFVFRMFRLCLFQLPVYVGVKYTSPTLASAITNLIPGSTFLFAVIFRYHDGEW
ncbi:hypothetical protein HanRHA438_Chr17g0808911 [Helianthus annuus]|nr:hypothetical protein HanHA300_Chr17g0650991 [Helianthus annuus]KAJ0447219.1 hypothetical protein HanHA89_Chr17g0702891 [Helianthus annuus]KAJ0632129.1 hypothetical protein HanLR1_Chr17g0661601 [Helianthus annuus]KAJ0798536.1 hypothetical protein HanLR1_Chr00c2948g0862041 [Helianthus annuus]KAJ0825960.1 hypothetical protein HanRHA438_Chr17g0808911 [Helianthus annuus]